MWKSLKIRLKRSANFHWKREVLLTAIPAFFWIFSSQYLIPKMVFFRCSELPETCSTDHLLWFDRAPLSEAIENPTQWQKNGPFRGRVDRISDTTQATAGALGFIIPVGIQVGRILVGTVAPPIGWAAAGADLLLVTQSVAWTGALNEVARLTIQRPRPFVYTDPVQHGPNASHYTSFFSGHTSFAAVATFAMFLCLLAGGVRPSILYGSAILCGSLTLVTGVLRILAAKHFPSDVITALIVGPLVALAIALLHRRSHKTPSLPG